MLSNSALSGHLDRPDLALHDIDGENPTSAWLSWISGSEMPRNRLKLPNRQSTTRALVETVPWTPRREGCLPKGRFARRAMECATSCPRVVLAWLRGYPGSSPSSSYPNSPVPHFVLSAHAFQQALKLDRPEPDIAFVGYASRVSFGLRASRADERRTHVFSSA